MFLHIKHAKYVFELDNNELSDIMSILKYISYYNKYFSHLSFKTERMYNQLKQAISSTELDNIISKKVDEYNLNNTVF